MSIGSFTPGPRSPGRGSSALGGDTARHRHFLGKALRAVRVYAEAMFRVVVLGEFAERAPFTRR
jgi:hypothetical protein